MKKMYGVITAMTTPFKEDGSLDVLALRKQTEWLINSGVNCLYPNGTTGEMYLMSAEERKITAETVVEEANGRLPVFIHVGSMHESETIELAKHAKAIGADGIGVVTPSFFNVSERGLVDYYRRVCEAVGDNFPVYVYAIPQLAHNDITSETLEKICEACPNVVGIKYSYPDFKRFLEYLDCKHGQLSCLFGADDLFLPALSMGADGTVSGCSGPFPELFTAIWKYYQEGNFTSAREAQKRANKIIKILKGGSDMSIFKHALTMRGIQGGYCRKPLTNLTAEETVRLENELKEFISNAK